MYFILPLSISFSLVSDLDCMWVGPVMDSLWVLGLLFSGGSQAGSFGLCSSSCLVWVACDAPGVLWEKDVSPEGLFVLIFYCTLLKHGLAS